MAWSHDVRDRAGAARSYRPPIPAELGPVPSSSTRPPTQFFRLLRLCVLTGLATGHFGNSDITPTPEPEIPLGLVALFSIPGCTVGTLVLAARGRGPRTTSSAFVAGSSGESNEAVGVDLPGLHRHLPPLVLGGVDFTRIGIPGWKRH